MDRVIEHMRFGPVMMSCDRMGISNFLNKVVVRGGDSRAVSICSGCQKEVISDENIPGSYNPAKPHVAGSMFTLRPEIIYYPIAKSHNLVFAVNLNRRIHPSTRATVSKLVAERRRMAG